ncbi:MAG: hypothetical protein KDD33_08765 [Bdellovibrionales bacterium]|nr:hypothetical protein [Bdellovibrionales bacterium]
MKASMIYLSFGLVALLTLTPHKVAAQNNTADYWQCQNKVGGEWNFGLIPNACDVDPFMPAQVVLDKYGPMLFDQLATRGNERNRYMQEMFSFVREFADYYIEQRKPGVSSAEKLAWRKAIYTIAHQESFWSHYRNKNSEVKMVRGDYGHGHGMMQIDDRWHFAKVKDGVAARLIDNMIYALEIYFDAWQKAPAQSCVSSNSQWIARTRTAYSAYNGGASSYCRWTNPNHKWAKNDKNFYDKFNAQSWLKYVDDPNKEASVDVNCLAEGHSNCPGQGGNPGNLESGKFYQTDKGKVCAYFNGRLHCIANEKDLACLNAKFNTKVTQPMATTAEELAKYEYQVYDRHTLCNEQISSLLPLQSYVLNQKAVTLLAHSEGAALAELSSGEKLYIEDFEIKNDEDQSIYYQVRWKAQIGYIAAGSNKHPQNFLMLSGSEDDFQFLAQVGDSIRIKNSGGINQRDVVRGKLIQNIPMNSELVVLDREFRDQESMTYYLVEYSGKKGYIYGGQLNPRTLHKWAERLRVEQTMASLKPYLWYVFPKSCAQDDCDNTDIPIWSARRFKDCPTCSDLQILEESGDWIRIYSDNNGAHGWVKKEVMDEH